MRSLLTPARLRRSELLGVALLAVTSQWSCGPPTPGVLVDTLDSWGAAAEAGLQVGDRVVSWQASPISDESELRNLSHPLELLRLEQEGSPSNPVTLTVQRGRSQQTVVLRSAEWGLHPRPNLGRQQLRRYRNAQERLPDEPSAAAAVYASLATLAEDAGRHAEAAWLDAKQVEALLASQDNLGALSAADRAVTRKLDSADRATLLRRLGTKIFEAGLYDNGKSRLEESLRLHQTLGSVAGEAASRNQLGRLGLKVQDPQAEEQAIAALALYRGLGNSALEQASVLNQLAGFAWSRRALDEAEEQYRRALAIRQEFGREGPDLGRLWYNLGLVAKQRGLYDVAADYYRKSLIDSERFEPEGRQVAFCLNSLGILAKDAGNFEEAIDHYQRALPIFRRLAPNGIEVAGILNNLGVAHNHLGHLEAAADYHRQALELRKQRPQSIDLASSLHNLGSIARHRNDVPGARNYLETALARKRELVPNSLLEASSLHQLGLLAASEGKLEEARQWHHQALEIRARVAPDHPHTAASNCSLGDLAAKKGDANLAIGHWEAAYRGLGVTQKLLRLSPEEEAGIAAPFQDCFRSYAATLAVRGQVTAAFEIIEGYRARALQLEIARRRGSAPSTTPPELVAEQRRAERKADRAQARLSQLSADSSQLEEQRLRLHQLRSEQARLAAAVKATRADGLLSDLSVPKLSMVHQALDPGTLLLVYGVGPDRTQLFVLGHSQDPPSIEHHLIEVDREELSRRISVFRQLIDRGRQAATLEPALLQQGSRLFELLLGPARQRIRGADRLVIVGEGPLLQLPFAALVPGIEDSTFLVEWRSHHLVASAGLYQQLRSHHGRLQSEIEEVVIFADPVLPPDSTLIADYGLAPLPGARREASTLAARFPGAVVYEGPQATEDRVKSLDRADLLHFATHALFHPRRPLESALVLTLQPEGAVPAGENNGLLHAWEVINELRLSSDLVVLSACETGRGLETPGEGLVGLTRAFLQAGARSVIASLWRVDDRPTESLMTSFYDHLQSGLSKDKALRSAQLDLLHGQAGVSSRHPYHWAGFQLHGDWQ